MEAKYPITASLYSFFNTICFLIIPHLFLFLYLVLCLSFSVSVVGNKIPWLCYLVKDINNIATFDYTKCQ